MTAAMPMPMMGSMMPMTGMMPMPMMGGMMPMAMMMCKMTVKFRVRSDVVISRSLRCKA